MAAAYVEQPQVIVHYPDGKRHRLHTRAVRDLVTFCADLERDDAASDGTAIGSPEHLTPAERLVSIAGAVRLVMSAHLGDGSEFAVLSRDEAEMVRNRRLALDKRCSTLLR
jgi:hypothetical protein